MDIIRAARAPKHGWPSENWAIRQESMLQRARVLPRVRHSRLRVRPQANLVNLGRGQDIVEEHHLIQQTIVVVR